MLFGFIAAITERVELATGVVVLPQRQTALVAKQAAEVDVLSDGRLRLGVGVGIKPDEFGALGQAYHNRGRRSEEQMEVMRALWTPPLIDYEGRWHTIRAGGINPPAGATTDTEMDRRTLRPGAEANRPAGRWVDAKLRAGPIWTRDHRHFAPVLRGGRT